MWESVRMGLREYRDSGAQHRDLIATVGELGARQYQALLHRLNWFAFGWMLGAVLIFVGIAFEHGYVLYLGVGAAVVSVVADGIAYVPISRTVASVLGRSGWWCADQMPTGSARFVLWMDAQIFKGTGSHVLGPEPARDGALRASRFARRLPLSGRAVTLVAATLGIAGIGHQWDSASHRGDGAPLPTTLSQITGESGLGAGGDVGPLLTCADPAESLVSAPLAEGGGAFRCTSARGLSVTYAYFATAADAQAWATAERTKEHLPASDTYVHGSAAAVTQDQVVLRRLNAASAASGSPTAN